MNVVGLIGSLFTLILNFKAMCFGRFLYGMSAGTLLCATPKYLDEVIPPRLIDKGFGTSTNILINLSVMMVLMLAIGMPDDAKDLQTTSYWYLLYMIQIPFQAFVIIMHLYVYTEEPIDFSVREGKRGEALKLISKVYSGESRENQIRFYE